MKVGEEITLEIHAVQGRNLPNKDFFKKQDPFLIFTIASDTKRSRVDKNGGTRPEWNQRIYFERLRHPVTSVMKIQCFDDEWKRKAQFIGECSLDLSKVYKVGECDGWFKLMDRGEKVGEVYLELTFHNQKHLDMKYSKVADTYVSDLAEIKAAENKAETIPMASTSQEAGLESPAVSQTELKPVANPEPLAVNKPTTEPENQTSPVPATDLASPVSHVTQSLANLSVLPVSERLQPLHSAPSKSEKSEAGSDYIAGYHPRPISGLSNSKPINPLPSTTEQAGLTEVKAQNETVQYKGESLVAQSQISEPMQSKLSPPVSLHDTSSIPEQPVQTQHTTPPVSIQAQHTTPPVSIQAQHTTPPVSIQAQHTTPPVSKQAQHDNTPIPAQPQPQYVAPSVSEAPIHTQPTTIATSTVPLKTQHHTNPASEQPVQTQHVISHEPIQAQHATPPVSVHTQHATSVQAQQTTPSVSEKAKPTSSVYSDQIQHNTPPVSENIYPNSSDSVYLNQLQHPTPPSQTQHTAPPVSAQALHASPPVSIHSNISPPTSAQAQATPSVRPQNSIPSVLAQVHAIPTAQHSTPPVSAQNSSSAYQATPPGSGQTGAKSGSEDMSQQAQLPSQILPQNHQEFIAAQTQVHEQQVLEAQAQKETPQIQQVQIDSSAVLATQAHSQYQGQPIQSPNVSSQIHGHQMQPIKTPAQPVISQHSVGQHPTQSPQIATSQSQAYQPQTLPPQAQSQPTQYQAPLNQQQSTHAPQPQPDISHQPIPAPHRQQSTPVPQHQSAPQTQTDVSQHQSVHASQHQQPTFAPQYQSASQQGPDPALQHQQQPTPAPQQQTTPTLQQPYPTPQHQQQSTPTPQQSYPTPQQHSLNYNPNTHQPPVDKVEPTLTPAHSYHPTPSAAQSTQMSHVPSYPPSNHQPSSNPPVQPGPNSEYSLGGYHPPNSNPTQINGLPQHGNTNQFQNANPIYPQSNTQHYSGHQPNTVYQSPPSSEPPTPLNIPHPTTPSSQQTISNMHQQPYYGGYVAPEQQYPTPTHHSQMPLLSPTNSYNYNQPQEYRPMGFNFGYPAPNAPYPSTNQQYNNQYSSYSAMPTLNSRPNSSYTPDPYQGYNHNGAYAVPPPIPNKPQNMPLNYLDTAPPPLPSRPNQSPPQMPNLPFTSNQPQMPPRPTDFNQQPSSSSNNSNSQVPVVNYQNYQSSSSTTEGEKKKKKKNPFKFLDF